MEDQDERSLKLVEMIYRTALDPRDYDGFMARWDDWMGARLNGLEELQLSDPAMSQPAIAAHFELAQRLIERIGDPPENTPGTGPRMLVNGAGTILWQNAEADRRFGKQTRRSVFEQALVDTHRETLLAFLETLSTDEPASPQVAMITPRDRGRPVAFQVEAMRRDHMEIVALLSAMAPPWPAAANKLLIDTHGLTEGECAICALLADGLAPASIAERRGTSVATVRTQIKKIQTKTLTNSQTELAAHLHSIQRMAEKLPVPNTPALSDVPTVAGKVTELTIGDRTLPVEEHGPKDGRPVIFLHGMLDGTATTARIWRSLQEHGLRLICPHRPSFGTSSSQPGRATQAPARLSEDMRHVIEHYDITTEPVVVGHMAGAVYTPEVATACGARGIVNISGGVPILSNRQFDAMSRRQRLVAYTARYARSVLPFVVNAGIRQIQSGGIERFLDSLYEHSPVDNELLRDREIRSLMQNGFRFTVVQGNRAFAVDSELVVTDWTERFNAAAPCPVHLIHGSHDPVVAVDSVRDFADRHRDRVTLTIVEDAGQLVFYQSPDLVLQKIASFFDA